MVLWGRLARLAGRLTHRHAWNRSAAFRPKGLLGLAYWWALWPVHQVVFRIMVRGRVSRVSAPGRGYRHRCPPRNVNPFGSTSVA